MDHDWRSDDEGIAISEAAAMVGGAADDGAFDAPPGILQSERRIHVRAYNRWTALRRGRAFPGPADLRSPELAEFMPRAIVLRYPSAEAAAEPEILFVGRALRDEAGLEAGAEPTLADMPPGSLVQRLAARHGDLASHRTPVGVEAEFLGSFGEATLYRAVMLPFSSDGHTIDHVCGVVNWKLAAPADVTVDMRDAVDQVRTRPMAPDRPAPFPAPHPCEADERHRAYLRDRPALAEARLDPVPFDDEFVLLVGRRQADGTVAIVAALPAGDATIAHAAQYGRTA